MLTVPADSLHHTLFSTAFPVAGGHLRSRVGWLHENRGITDRMFVGRAPRDREGCRRSTKSPFRCETLVVRRIGTHRGCGNLPHTAVSLESTQDSRVNEFVHVA